MKILIPTFEYPPQVGGISSYIFNIVTKWPKKEDDFVIYTSQLEGGTEHDQASDIKVYRSKMLYKIFRPRWLRLFFVICRIIKKQKIKRVFVHHVLPIGYAMYLISKFKKVKYDVFLHGYDFGLAVDNYSKAKKFVKICTKSERIIVNSKYLKNLISEKYPKLQNKIIVVYPCSSLEDVRIESEKKEEVQKKYNPEKRPLIFTTSRIVKRKGHEDVIKSLHKVRKEIPNILYLICGEGEYRQTLIDLVKKENLKDSVNFIDFVSKEDLPYLYSISDVFAMPSKQLDKLDIEGFGIVFLGANQFGKPVIGGKSGGMPEAIEDGVNGYTIEHGDVDQISEKVINLLNNKELAKQMGERGRQRIKKEFNWNVQLNKLC